MVRMYQSYMISDTRSITRCFAKQKNNQKPLCFLTPKIGRNDDGNCCLQTTEFGFVVCFKPDQVRFKPVYSYVSAFVSRDVSCRQVPSTMKPRHKPRIKPR